MKASIRTRGGFIALALSVFVFATPIAGAGEPADPGGGGGGGSGPATVPTYFEQGILTRSGETVPALGPNLMGDQVNVYSGDLSFTQVDVSLPGNNALPVQVARHRSASTAQAYAAGGLFGDWDLDIPHLYSVAAAPQPNWYGGNSTANLNRCSEFREPPWTGFGTDSARCSYDARAFWDGYHLHVPGGGDQTLLETGPLQSDRTEFRRSRLSRRHQGALAVLLPSHAR